jgi:hypothetical protein
MWVEDFIRLFKKMFYGGRGEGERRLQQRLNQQIKYEKRDRE